MADQDELFDNLPKGTKAEQIETELDLTSPSPQARKPDAPPAIEVEIVDDTPVQDRGRQPPAKAGEEPTDEELDSYSEGVKKRINALTYEKHEFRRRAEEADRERHAAADYIRGIQEENKRLKSLASMAGQALKGEATKGAESRIQSAERAYKSAYEAGDADKMVEAQREIAAAQYALEDAKKYEAPVFAEEKEQEKPAPQRQMTQQEVEARQKMDQWVQKNQWFTGPGNEEMKGVGYAMHSKLTQQGIMPNTDEYYRHVDRRLRQLFPDHSWPDQERQTARTVVAPASRAAPGASTKIRLSQSQVNLAKRLGLTPEQYAAELKRMNDNA